jgi:hypothetical protein
VLAANSPLRKAVTALAAALAAAPKPVRAEADAVAEESTVIRAAQWGAGPQILSRWGLNFVSFSAAPHRDPLSLR